MRLPFRFLRGELNGVYVTSIMSALNTAVSDVISELVYQKTLAFKAPEDVSADESPVRESDMEDIGKIAGIYRIIIQTYGSIRAIKFTTSNIVNGEERSDRGLYNIDSEEFEFVHTEQDDYTEDITDLATEKKIASFIPHEQAPIGYNEAGTDIIDDDGNVIEENVLSEPPDGTPYAAFYGQKFARLENYAIQRLKMPFDLYLIYFMLMMKLRRYPPTVQIFLQITELIGQGYITNVEIVPSNWYYIVYYDLDTSVGSLWDGIRGSNINTVWRNIVGQKFKNYYLQERVT